MKRFVLFAALLLAISTTPTQAAGSLQMAVRPGYEGAAKYGTWMPVEVELQNSGPEVVGELELSVQGQASRAAWNRPPVVYSVPVTLPDRSRKRVTIDVYFPGLEEEIDVQLVSGGEVLLKQPVTVERVLATEMFCGVLASNSRELDFLSTIELTGYQRRLRLAHLDPLDLPTAPHLLSSLDCLIFANVSSNRLTDPQKNALLHWVHGGGLLVLGGGPGAEKTLDSLPTELLPVKVVGSRQVRGLTKLGDLTGHPPPENGPWLVGDAVTTDGVVVVEEDGVPLLVAAPRGSGAVVYLGLDPMGQPLRGWAGGEVVWRHVFSYAPMPRVPYNTFARQYTNWGRLPRIALADLSEAENVSTSWLTYLLIGFAITVGPLNHLVLRRLGRLEWGIVTIPAMTAGAAMAAIVMAQSNPSRDLVVNNLSTIRTWDGEHALVHSYVGVFSSRDQSPELRLPEGSLVAPLYYPFPLENPTAMPAWSLRVQQSDRPTLRNFGLRPGSLGTFAVDRWYRMPGHVESALTLEDSRIHGNITSRMSRPLRDVAVIVGTNVVKLGDLTPDATHSIDLALDRTGTDLYDVVGQLYPLDEEEMPPSEVGRRDLLLSVINPRGSFSTRVDISPVTLIGWIDDTPLGNLVQTNRVAPLDRTLLIATLPVRTPAGVEIQVPEAVVTKRPFFVGTAPRERDGVYTFSNGDAIAWEYQLPFDLAQFSLKEVRFDLEGSITGGTAGATLPDFGPAQLYDWHRAEWVPVELEFGANRLADFDRYVSALGTIRFRYVFRPPATAPESVSATFTNFALVVRGTGR